MLTIVFDVMGHLKREELVKKNRPRYAMAIFR